MYKNVTYRLGGGLSLQPEPAIRRYRKRVLLLRAYRAIERVTVSPYLTGALLLACFLSVSFIVTYIKALGSPTVGTVGDEHSLFENLSISWEQSNSRLTALKRIGLQEKQQKESLIHFVAEVINSHRAKGGNQKQSREMASFLVRESIAKGFDPLLVAAIIKHESTFNPLARSPMGAIGLMQVLPSTSTFISQVAGLKSDGSRDLHLPHRNLQVGIAYLSYLRAMFNNNPQQILIAYNWGPENFKRSISSGSTPPKGTILYAQKVLTTFKKLQDSFKELAPRYRHFDLGRAWALNNSSPHSIG